jgi:TPR repeat protein
MTRRLFAVILLGVMAVAPALADEARPTPDETLRAAQAGNAEAQLNLGILYEYGYHLQGNKVEALAWYMAAADQGLKLAAQHRDKLMAELTPAQVEQARARSAKIARAPAAPKTPPAVESSGPMPSAGSATEVPEAASVPPTPTVETAPVP